MTAPEPALVRVVDAVCEKCAVPVRGSRKYGPFPYVCPVSWLRGEDPLIHLLCGGQVRVATEPVLSEEIER